MRARRHRRQPRARCGRSVPSGADHAGLLGVIASEAAFADGDGWLDGVLTVLDGNRTLLEQRLVEGLGVPWRRPDASYLAWLDLGATGLGEDPAAALLTHGRLAVVPGTDYGTPGRGHVRLNFGTSPEIVADMVQRIGATLEAGPR